MQKMSDITEYGEVVKITGDTAHIKFKRSSACGRCRACGMLSGQNEIVVLVGNTMGAKPGDFAAVSIRMQKALRASALAYVFPLAMLIIGVLAGWLLSAVWGVFENADLSMALFGLIFAVLSFVLLKLLSPSYNKTVSNVYKMVEVKHKKNTGEE